MNTFMQVAAFVDINGCCMHACLHEFDGVCICVSCAYACIRVRMRAQMHMHTHPDEDAHSCSATELHMRTCAHAYMRSWAYPHIVGEVMHACVSEGARARGLRTCVGSMGV